MLDTIKTAQATVYAETRAHKITLSKVSPQLSRDARDYTPVIPVPNVARLLSGPTRLSRPRLNCTQPQQHSVSVFFSTRRKSLGKGLPVTGDQVARGSCPSRSAGLVWTASRKKGGAGEGAVKQACEILWLACAEHSQTVLIRQRTLEAKTAHGTKRSTSDHGLLPLLQTGPLNIQDLPRARAQRENESMGALHAV